MSIKIMLDSSCCLTQEEAKKLNVRVFPLRLSFGDEHLLDGIDMDLEKFYHYLVDLKKFPKTALPNVYEIEEEVKKELDQGNQVLYISVGSKMSGSFNAVHNAIGHYENVRIVDSMSSICGSPIMLDYALSNINDDLETLYQKCQALAPKIRLIASLDTLEYLYRGGRVKKITALLGTLFLFKPSIEVSDGEVKMIGKKRGIVNSMNFLKEIYEKDDVDPNFPVCALYTRNIENATKLFNILGKNIDKSINICPAVASHLGQNAYGLIYVTK